MKFAAILLLILKVSIISKALPTDPEKDEERIIGGYVVEDKDKYPFMAVLVEKSSKEQLCGGSLISKRHVLTAAHCVGNITKVPFESYDASVFAVLIGGIQISKMKDNRKCFFPVSKVEVHPEVSFKKGSAIDLAVLTLRKMVKDSAIVSLTRSPPEIKDQLVILGYGRVSPYDPSKRSDVLKYLPVNVTGLVSHSIRVENSGRSACHGDSGGPLIGINKNGKWQLMGVTSHADERDICINGASYYMDVTEFKDWIQSKITLF